MPILIVLVIFCISSVCAPAATAEATEQTATCQKLEQLWDTLYGPYNPLKKYTTAYRTAIATYATLQNRAVSRSADPATDLVLNQFQTQLAALKEQADALLSQYTIVPSSPANPADPLTLITHPTTYVATPTSGTPATQETLLQELLQKIQHLSSTAPAPSDKSLKEQLLLFFGGITFLALVTGLIHYRIASDCRTLEREVMALRKQYETPHTCVNGAYAAGTTGILPELDHIKNLLTAENAGNSSHE